MAIKKPDLRSIGEYLEYEYVAQGKHEYEKGEIFAMFGGTINHGVLCGNVYNELRRKIEAGDANCRVIGSEVRIHIQRADSIVYPDAMVICEELQVSKEDSEAVINPTLIAEVLSKSTESYDRGDKFYKYRQLPSLKEYVLIDQEKPVVETFYKRENNIWEISRATGLEEVIEIKCLGFNLSLRELYVDVNWQKEEV